MKVDRRKLTKEQALKLTNNDPVALACALGIGPDAIRRWNAGDAIPEHWSLILVNLLFRERFSLPPIPDIKRDKAK